MSIVNKCDITNKADVPTFKVDAKREPNEGEPIRVPVIRLFDERIEYQIHIANENGYSAIDVSQEYVYEDIISLATKELNELRNPAKNQTDTGEGSEIKVI